MNLRVLWGLAHWVRDQHGDDVLARIAEGADLPVEHLDGRSHWVSHDRFEAFLRGCRALTSSDEQFEEACTHRLPEAYGPLRFALRAVSPRLMYVQAAKNLQMVSRISAVEILDERRNFMRARYTTERHESTLMSLSREAQTKAMPTLWGLPKADLRVLWRDETGNTEYEVRWRVKPTWLPTLAGVLGGLLVAVALTYLGISFGPMTLLLLLPVVGGAVGHITDLHRTAELNQAHSASQTEALEQLATEAFEAKREAFDLSSRHQDWSRMMEQRVDARNRELRALRERLEQFGPREADRDRLRGVSHDLRSPLQLITSNLELLRARVDDPGSRAQVIAELERSAKNMTVYLEELMGSFTAEPGFALGAPAEVETDELEETLRRRLKAFVHSGGVRTTVFSTREAPHRIVVNRAVLDRVLDNLLTNAAKYTHRGSILVEVGGTPGYLTIKVSDTGRGIEEEMLRKVFVPGGSDEQTRAPSSYGVGLSIVLRLMNEIGGRLEVMSRVDEGTTFWAHFPRTPPETRGEDDLAADAPYAELLERVVTIRRH